MSSVSGRRVREPSVVSHSQLRRGKEAAVKGLTQAWSSFGEARELLQGLESKRQKFSHSHISHTGADSSPPPSERGNVVSEGSPAHHSPDRQQVNTAAVYGPPVSSPGAASTTAVGSSKPLTAGYWKTPKDMAIRKFQLPSDTVSSLRTKVEQQKQAMKATGSRITSQPTGSIGHSGFLPVHEVPSLLPLHPQPFTHSKPKKRKVVAAPPPPSFSGFSSNVAAHRRPNLERVRVQDPTSSESLRPKTTITPSSWRAGKELADRMVVKQSSRTPPPSSSAAHSSMRGGQLTSSNAQLVLDLESEEEDTGGDLGEPNGAPVHQIQRPKRRVAAASGALGKKPKESDAAVKRRCYDPAEVQHYILTKQEDRRRREKAEREARELGRQQRRERMEELFARQQRVLRANLHARQQQRRSFASTALLHNSARSDTTLPSDNTSSPPHPSQHTTPSPHPSQHTMPSPHSSQHTHTTPSPRPSQHTHTITTPHLFYHISSTNPSHPPVSTPSHPPVSTPSHPPMSTPTYLSHHISRTQFTSTKHSSPSTKYGGIQSPSSHCEDPSRTNREKRIQELTQSALSLKERIARETQRLLHYEGQTTNPSAGQGLPATPRGKKEPQWEPRVPGRSAVHSSRLSELSSDECVREGEPRSVAQSSPQPGPAILATPPPPWKTGGGDVMSVVNVFARQHRELQARLEQLKRQKIEELELLQHSQSQPGCLESAASSASWGEGTQLSSSFPEADSSLSRLHVSKSQQTTKSPQVPVITPPGSPVLEKSDPGLAPGPAVRHLSPRSLELKLQAELQLLESMQGSIQQLASIEGARTTSMVQQEAASLALVLQSREKAHKEELTAFANRAKQEVDLVHQDVSCPRPHTTTALGETISREDCGMEEKGPAGVEVTLAMSSSPTVSGAEQTQGTASLEPTEPVEAYNSDFESSMQPDSLATSSLACPDSSTETLVEGGDELSETMVEMLPTPSHSGVEEDIDEVSFRELLPSESHRRHCTQRRMSSGSESHISSPTVSCPPAFVVPAASNSPPDTEESFFQFMSRMVWQYMHEEELRARHQATLLALREAAMKERTEAEVAWLQLQKKRVQNKGADDLMPRLLKKEERLLKQLEHEQAGIQQLKEVQKAAKYERELMLLQHKEISLIHHSAQSYRSKIHKYSSSQHSQGDAKLSAAPLVSHSTSFAESESESEQRLQPDMSELSSVAEDLTAKYGAERASAGSTPSEYKGDTFELLTHSNSTASTSAHTEHSSGASAEIQSHSGGGSLETRIAALKTQLQARKEEARRIQLKQRRKKKALLEQQEGKLRRKLEAVESVISRAQEPLPTLSSASSASSVDSPTPSPAPLLPEQVVSTPIQEHGLSPPSTVEVAVSPETSFSYTGFSPTPPHIPPSHSSLLSHATAPLPSPPADSVNLSVQVPSTTTPRSVSLASTVPEELGSGIIEESVSGIDEELSPGSGSGTIEELPPRSGSGTDEELPPRSGSGIDEELPPRSGSGTVEELPPRSGSGTVEELPPRSGSGTVEELPPRSESSTDEELPPRSGSGIDEELPPKSGSGIDEELSQDCDSGSAGVLEELEEVPPQSELDEVGLSKVLLSGSVEDLVGSGSVEELSHESGSAKSQDESSDEKLLEPVTESGHVSPEGQQFAIAQRVLVGEVMSGTVQFVGQTLFAEGIWVGVELDLPMGKNDGSVAGHHYFSCKPLHGIFAPPNKVSLFSREEAAEEVHPVNEDTNVSCSYTADFFEPSSGQTSLVADGEGNVPVLSVCYGQTERSEPLVVQHEEPLFSASAETVTTSVHVALPSDPCQTSEFAWPVDAKMKVEAITCDLAQDLSNEAFETIHCIWMAKKDAQGRLLHHSSVDNITNGLLASLLHSEVSLMWNIRSSRRFQIAEQPSSSELLPAPTSLSIPPSPIEFSPPPLSPPSPYHGSPEPSPPGSPPRHLSQASAARVAAGERSPFLSFTEQSSRKASSPAITDRASSVESLSQLLDSIQLTTAQCMVPSDRETVGKITEYVWNTANDSGLGKVQSASLTSPPNLLSLIEDEQELSSEERHCRQAFLELIYHLALQTMRVLQAAREPCTHSASTLATSKRPNVEAVQQKVYATLTKNQLPPQLPAVRYLQGTRRPGGKEVDAVDTLLIWEGREEEPGWVDYTQDEALVKHRTADALLEFLLSETVHILHTISAKRCSLFHLHSVEQQV